MWDDPQPPNPGFRECLDEPFPPRWPDAHPPRMSDRPHFPFRGGARVPSSHFGSQGSLPYSRREVGTGQHALWQEDRIPPEDPINYNLSRMGLPPGNYRAVGLQDEEMRDSDYREPNTLGNEFRGLLALDMDYREKEASIVDHRESGRSDVDYRLEEESAIAYRERLPPPSIFRERESLEYRKRVAAEVELRERASLELEHRERLATALDYRDRDVSELEYKRRLNILLEQRKWETALLGMRQREAAEMLLLDRISPDILIREREAAAIREREAAALAVREREALREREAAALAVREREAVRQREAVALAVRQREAAALAVRQREAVELALRAREVMELEMRQRMVMNYRETGTPGHYRESVDHNLRATESEAVRLRESNMEAHMIDRDRGLDYRDRVIIDYSGSENNALPYREEETAHLDYMEVEYKKEAFDGSPQEPAALGYGQEETLHAQYENMEIPGFTIQKHTDMDYLGKETINSEYWDNEIRDSDYRGRVNTGLDYRDMEAVDSDYRNKEKTDSYYLEKESEDSDYRNGGGNPVVADSDDSPSVQKTSQNALTEIKPATDYSEVPTHVLAPNESPSVLNEPLPNADAGSIPFSSYEEPQKSALPNVKSEGPQQICVQSTTTTKGEVQSESEPASCPGKLDMDFRDRPKPDPKQDLKEVAEKAVGYTDSPSKEICPSDQDLRKKEDFSKESKMVDCDQDFRSGGYKQEKDEDLRVGKEQRPVDLLDESSLLFDFLKIAAQELKQQKDKGSVWQEPGGDVVSHTSETPVTDLLSNQAQATASAKPSGLESAAPGMKFLSNEDADYRKTDFKDVDLRRNVDIRLGHQAKGLDKRSQGDPQPGSKDKDYRRAALPDGATRIIWLDGLPTGASREEILSTLSGAHRLPVDDVNLIGYIPGYSLGSVCVEFSLVEEAVGCMEANKGIVYFKGKKINLKYIPNSDRWNCQQCKTVNVLSKERCWQCSALRAGSDHLPLRDARKVLPASYRLPSPRGKKRKARQNSSARSPDRSKEKTPPRERSPLSKSRKETRRSLSNTATVIIKGLGFYTTADSVVKALKPYAQISVHNVRVVRNRKSERCGFGFVDLKDHKEATRLTVQMRELKPPLKIDGKPINMDLSHGRRCYDQPKAQKGAKAAPRKEATRLTAQMRERKTPLKIDGKPINVHLALGRRRDDQPKAQKGAKAAPRKGRRHRGPRRKGPGNKGKVDRNGPSFVFDPKTGSYVDPLTNAVFDASKMQHTKEEQPLRAPGKEPATQRRRGFTEDKEEDGNEDPFKRPLPPQMTKKEEPAPELKDNPLIKLLGEYGDSDEEEEQEELVLPPLRKKPPPPPPPPAPKPIPKPVAPVASSSKDDKLTDWKKMVCLLCRRQFFSKETLIKHQMLSLLHKQNMALHENTKKSQKELTLIQQKEMKETGKGLDSGVHGPETKNQKVPDKSSETQTRAEVPASPESYLEHKKRLVLARYKKLK
ncbi:RNA-binding protein 6-like isoform X2 [Pseudophryne corroboree]|uniref:RNA-binding protein 6-like isoform X2 n=1 Tax=Pseudophryne corroboree TaxID=495146 RepID=UPI003081A0CA